VLREKKDGMLAKKRNDIWASETDKQGAAIICLHFSMICKSILLMEIQKTFASAHIRKKSQDTSPKMEAISI